jgi:hypothetical protein
MSDEEGVRLEQVATPRYVLKPQKGPFNDC